MKTSFEPNKPTDLDSENYSNFAVKDLFTPTAVKKALWSGNPLAAISEAKRQEDLLKAKLQLSSGLSEKEKEALQSQLSDAQSLVAQAEAALAEKASSPSSGEGSTLRVEDEAKKFPWMTVSLISAGVIVVGLSAYFIFKK